MSIKRPMKASAVTDLSIVEFPCYVQPKIDGIRCTLIDGVAYSASMKPIRNLFVQKTLKEFHESLSTFFPLDGELIVGDLYDNNFQATTSGVMSIDGEPEFTFVIFDVAMQCLDFDGRLRLIERLSSTCEFMTNEFIQVSPSVVVNNIEELTYQITQYEEAGFEGTMIRNPDRTYKEGRSTLKEQALLKVKKFSDAEAVIVGYEEEMHNSNEKTTNELGLSERSSAKANLTGKDTLGAFVVEFNGLTFNIGSGFTKEQRKEFWISRKLLIAKTVKFKYFDYGIKDAPRHPVFLGFRDVEDMTHY